MKKQTCPSCKAQVDPDKTHCPSCGWQFQTEDALKKPSIVNPAPRPKIQCEVDLAITIDRTGSSNAFITGIPKTVEGILNPISAKARNIKCWLTSHGDLDEGQEIVIHTDGGPPSQTIKDLQLINFSGGGDPPEHHLDAIEFLWKKIPWTADPTRARGAILALINADTKPAKSGITAAELGQALKKSGLLFYLVCEPTPTLKDLVDGAEGMMFEISNDPDIQELQRIASELAASIVVTIGSGGTVPMNVAMDNKFKKDRK